MVPTKMKDLPEAWVRSVDIRMLMVFVKLDFMLFSYILVYPDIQSDNALEGFNAVTTVLQ
jgi:hypothetical protein